MYCKPNWQPAGRVSQALYVLNHWSLTSSLLSQILIFCEPCKKPYAKRRRNPRLLPYLLLVYPSNFTTAAFAENKQYLSNWCPPKFVMTRVRHDSCPTAGLFCCCTVLLPGPRRPLHVAQSETRRPWRIAKRSAEQQLTWILKLLTTKVGFVRLREQFVFLYTVA